MLDHIPQEGEKHLSPVPSARCLHKTTQQSYCLQGLGSALLLLPGSQAPLCIHPGCVLTPILPWQLLGAGFTIKARKPAEDRPDSRSSYEDKKGRELSNIFLLHLQTAFSPLLPECSEKLLHFSAPLSLCLRSSEPF